MNGSESSKKIIPPYRRDAAELREKYAMDKAVLLQLKELFRDAPSAEEFMQITNT